MSVRSDPLNKARGVPPHRDTVKALADALDLSNAARSQFEEVAARARGRSPRADPAIPVRLTSFIERNEVNELQAMLEEHRLVTVTGSGGLERLASQLRWCGALRRCTTKCGSLISSPFAPEVY